MDESSIGLPIDVFYETINHTITEWLVKARNGIWDDPSLNINWFNGSCLMQNPIQEMFEYRDVISDADLLLLQVKLS